MSQKRHYDELRLKILVQAQISFDKIDSEKMSYLRLGRFLGAILGIGECLTDKAWNSNAARAKASSAKIRTSQNPEDKLPLSADNATKSPRRSCAPDAKQRPTGENPTHLAIHK